jgi:hypothetical protein
LGDEIRYVCDKWDDGSYEDGWAGGIIDGEGCVRVKTGGAEVALSQVLGPVYNRFRSYLASRGYTFRESVDRRNTDGSGKAVGRLDVGRIEISRMNEIFRLLGQARPSRTRKQWWNGKDLPGKSSGIGWSKVVKIEAVAPQRMIDLQTTAKTFIADGFVSHNSTVSQALVFHKTLFTEGCTAMVVAQDPDQSGYLFDKSRLALTHLPWWMQPEVRYEEKNKNLTFDRKDPNERSINPGLNSEILVEAANKMSGAGVGKTIRTAHLSELGKWPNDPTILTQFLFPAMNASDELAFMESTARGRDQFFYDLWKAAVSGKLGWTPVFIEFFRVKKYSIPLDAGLTLRRTVEENEIVERVKKDTGVILTDDQLNWRRKKIEETVALEGSEWGFYQEYPINWHQAFQASGTCAFDKKKLNQLMLTRCCDPKWTGSAGLERDSRNNKWNPVIKLTAVPRGEEAPSQEQYGHNLHVWEQPDPRHGYYISGDPSLGVEGGDPSCVQVMKIGRGKLPDEQVAEWWGHLSPSPFAEVVVALAMWYNGGEVAIECNGEVGAMANNTLFRELAYDRVFQWKHYDKVKNFRTDYIGWYTDGDTRPKLIAKMREAIDDNKIILRSEALVDEMMAFSSVKKGRFEGQGMHDDRVLSMMICRWCAHDSDWAVEVSTTPIDDSKIFGYVCTYEVSHHWPNLQSAQAEGARPLPLAARQIAGGTGYGCPICRSSENRNAELKFIPNKDFSNSEFSPIHDVPNGLRAGMAARGIPVHDIWPDEVSSGLPPTADDAWKIL